MKTLSGWPGREHAGWISPKGKFHPLGDDPNHSEFEHHVWATKNKDLPGMPDVSGMKPRQVMAKMLQSGWTAKVDHENYRVARQHSSRLSGRIRSHAKKNHPEFSGVPRIEVMEQADELIGEFLLNESVVNRVGKELAPKLGLVPANPKIFNKTGGYDQEHNNCLAISTHTAARFGYEIPKEFHDFWRDRFTANAGPELSPKTRKIHDASLVLRGVPGKKPSAYHVSFHHKKHGEFNYGPHSGGDRPLPIVAVFPLKRHSGLQMSSVKENGVHFETGVPVEFKYSHNPEKAPDMGTRFGQHLEPHGKYMTHLPGDTEPAPGRESSTHRFENPLVLHHGTTSGDPHGWKARLSDAFGGRSGKSLTQALIDSGHDGVVTVDMVRGKPYTGEIVALPKSLKDLTDSPVKALITQKLG